MTPGERERKDLEEKLRLALEALGETGTVYEEIEEQADFLQEWDRELRRLSPAEHDDPPWPPPSGRRRQKLTRLERIALYRTRLENGRHLHHPDDLPYDRRDEEEEPLSNEDLERHFGPERDENP